MTENAVLSPSQNIRRDMADYFRDGVIDNAKVMNAINEISEKLSEEKDDKKRTQLMFEQMLRGVYLQYNGQSI